MGSKPNPAVLKRIAQYVRQAPQRARLEATEDQAVEVAIRKLADSQAFIIGRWVQHQITRGHGVPELRSADDLISALNPYLTRDYDRVRFGLEPREPNQTEIEA